MPPLDTLPPRAPSDSSLGARLRTQPALALLPLRLFLGVTFTYAGLSKLASHAFFDAKNPTSIQGQLALVRHASPLSFLLGAVAQHAVFFGAIIAVAEVAVGVATLVGLWGRLAALGGALLALSFFLTISWRTSPYFYGADIVFLFAWTPQLLLGTPLLSLDAWRTASVTAASVRGARVREADLVDQQRRAVLATGAVGAAVVFAAGVDAALGQHGSGPAQVTGAGPTSTPSTRHAAAGPKAGPTGRASATGAPVRGTAVGDTARLPVGGALPFTDPGSGQPAFAVQPAAGHYAAFSAVCTHAGCTVAFDQGSEQFVCPCHGGTYSAKTGQVLGGPPPAPLPTIRIDASNGQLVVPDGS